MIDKPNAMEIQAVLTAIQMGDISTGRARELIEVWLDGKYAHDLLPPINLHNPFGEDDWPAEIATALQAQLEWIKAKDELPQCDGEKLFTGVNSAGFAGVFNRIDNLGHDCFYETAEETITVFSELAVWRQLIVPVGVA